MALLEVTDATYQAEVVDAQTPVFVKFTATWCAPCRQIAPAVAGLAADFADEMKFVEVDIDRSPEIAKEHAIQGVPQFLILRRGERVAHTMAAISRTRLAEFIEESLEGAAA